jgi:hypothetical protein
VRAKFLCAGIALFCDSLFQNQSEIDEIAERSDTALESCFYLENVYRGRPFKK